MTPGKPGQRPSGLDRSRGVRVEESLQLVAFTVADGHYALDIMRIKEIVNPMPVTRVPKAPGFIEGVIELRGAILPIVDLRKRFDLPAEPYSRATKFLIVGIDVGGKRMIVGLVVDGVLEPLRVPKESVRAAPALAQGEQAYFSGVVQRRQRERVDGREARKASEDDDRIFMLLDIDAILSSKEKISLEGMGGAA
jgi:purine-binding chemotaxis protein CheW